MRNFLKLFNRFHDLALQTYLGRQFKHVRWYNTHIRSTREGGGYASGTNNNNQLSPVTYPPL